jgi:hypothetical protein
MIDHRQLGYATVHLVLPLSGAGHRQQAAWLPVSYPDAPLRRAAATGHGSCRPSLRVVPRFRCTPDGPRSQPTIPRQMITVLRSQQVRQLSRSGDAAADRAARRRGLQDALASYHSNLAVYGDHRIGSRNLF